jgi:pimeloyl-ACP methyl ester carboxylesterase
MPTTTRDDVTLQYETFGDPANPTLLLVNGLGSQLINYEPEFCNLFVGRGYHVVIFDNRDVGLSSKTEGPLPDVAAMMARFRAGESVEGTPYTLTDMADDGFAVLDAVGASAAHIAGMSMGGMIVQRMALNHPERVLSMTSIMSSTGNSDVGQATPEAAATLVAAPPTDREGYIEHTIAARKVTAGSHFSADYWRAHAGKLYDRMFHPVGAAFQIAAIAADGDRTTELQQLSVPSLVIHGRRDPLITLSGGEATAAAIPGAELLVIDEMGHDLPAEIWTEVSDAIMAVAERK